MTTTIAIRKCRLSVSERRAKSIHGSLTHSSFSLFFYFLLFFALKITEKYLTQIRPLGWIEKTLLDYTLHVLNSSAHNPTRSPFY